MNRNIPRGRDVRDKVKFFDSNLDLSRKCGPPSLYFITLFMDLIKNVNSVLGRLSIPGLT